MSKKGNWFSRWLVGFQVGRLLFFAYLVATTPARFAVYGVAHCLRPMLLIRQPRSDIKYYGNIWLMFRWYECPFYENARSFMSRLKYVLGVAKMTNKELSIKKEKNKLRIREVLDRLREEEEKRRANHE
jgi:hypothetical protein